MNPLQDLPAMVEWPALVSMMARLALNLTSAFIIVGVIYSRRYATREFVFTYYLFNVITCVLCLLLRRVPTNLGFALALFGVFGILRYRTEQIRIRDLTYLFVVIGLGLLNGVADASVSVAELLLVNVAIVAATAWQDGRATNAMQRTTNLMYDQLSLLTPGNRGALLDDLSRRIGLRVVRVEVGRIDLLRDCAEITAVHHENA